MRPIFATEDDNEYTIAWDRLIESGIPVFEPSKFSNVPGFKIGPHHRVLAIWLDHQYEDAMQLLRDPSHIVANPVDVDEFAQIQDQVDDSIEEQTDQATEKTLNWVFAFIAAALIGAVAYIAFRQ
ncbi:hypothetical protein UNDKW_4604 [Undibacterium sp. KW1]|uniref:hypothetical protein n=1 Tax=Undibacterium sp. KW1 TaxID=2058624 RepID=UPI001331D734|nr:hypothetical protein [Undibacterium sp. KW1]BBB62877.1 hypothetical protein UNDKW_4604 [Undibacterium sp. KW1]